MSAGASNTTYQNSQGSNTPATPSPYDATAFSSTGRDQSGVASLGSFGFRKKTPVGMTPDQQQDTGYKPTSSTFMDAGVVNKTFVAPSTPINSFPSPLSGGSGESSQSSGGSMWSAGTGNIAGGNQRGYAGDPLVGAGMGLKVAANNYPAWAPGGAALQLGAGLFADPLIGYQEVDSMSGPVMGTRGSFESGAFHDNTQTDISGGAMGSNVVTNNFGDVASQGYGYGQIDPNIASAAGWQTNPNYNPTPASVTSTSVGFNGSQASNMTAAGVDPGIANAASRSTGSTSVQTTNPATGVTSTEYFSNTGTSQGSYTPGQGLTLTDRNDDGSYNVPTQVSGGGSSSSDSSSGGK